MNDEWHHARRLPIADSSAIDPLLSTIVAKDVAPAGLVDSTARSAAPLIVGAVVSTTLTKKPFVAMTFGVAGVLYFLEIKDQPGAFWGFFAMFVFLFFVSGVGNASTFQMIPAIFARQHAAWAAGGGAAAQAEAAREAAKESAAVLGFSSAIGAYGAFFIPKSFGTSIGMTGGPEAALYLFLAFYVSCLAVNWWFYTRGGAELRFGADPTAPATAATAT
jgi:NNP family nitrate/nitrite transporter-like MFS transporter